MDKYSIINKAPDRDTLMEGRNYGMGFSFLKKTDEGYELYQPLTACKDFLNEQIHSEHTGEEATAYGMITNKVDMFVNGSFLILKILPFNDGSFNTNVPTKIEVDYLIDGFNQVEKIFNLEYSTIEFISEEGLVIKLNSKWTSTYQAISFATFCLRVIHQAQGKVEINNLNDIKIVENILPPDYYMIKSFDLEDLNTDKLFEFHALKHYHDKGGFISFLNGKNCDDDDEDYDEYEDDDDY